MVKSKEKPILTEITVRRVMVKPPIKWISELKLEGLEALEFDNIDILEKIVNHKNLQLLDVTIMANIKVTNKKRVTIGSGKCGYDVLPEAIRVPSRKHRITEKYSEYDLISDLKELKAELTEKYPEYNIKLYIVDLVIKESGDDKKVIVWFAKGDPVDPLTTIGKLIGRESQPLDVYGIYEESWYRERKRKEKELAIIDEVTEDVPFVKAMKVRQYVPNLYASGIVMVRECKMGEIVRKIKGYVKLKHDSCKEGKLFPEELEKKISEKDLMEGVV